MTDVQLIATIGLVGSSILGVGATVAGVRALRRREESAYLYRFLSLLGLQGVCTGAATLVRPSRPMLAWILTGLAALAVAAMVLQMWRDRRRVWPSRSGA